MDMIHGPSVVVPAPREPRPAVCRTIDLGLPDHPGDVRLIGIVEQLVEYFPPDLRIYFPAPPGVVPNVEANMVVIPWLFFFGRVINIRIATPRGSCLRGTWATPRYRGAR